MRMLIFLLVILIPACDLCSLAFHMIAIIQLCITEPIKIYGNGVDFFNLIIKQIFCDVITTTILFLLLLK